MDKIQNRAMLVSLKISAWSARKYDKKITAEVAAKHAVNGNEVGRYIKKLLPQDSKSYAALNAALGDMRSAHYAQTLSWTDEGWRVLPSKNFMQYGDDMRTRRSIIESRLDNFISDYPALREQAKVMLNGMWMPEDYPEPLDLRKRYTIKTDYAPMPAGEDFRVSLDADTLAEIARDTEDRVSKAVAAAQQDAFERLHGCVARIAERLSNPEAIFRDSLIDNAREVTDVLTRLNIAEDARLEALRVRVEELAQVSPETLRTLPHVRRNTAQEADKILADMLATFGEVTAA